MVIRSNPLPEKVRIQLQGVNIYTDSPVRIEIDSHGCWGESDQGFMEEGEGLGPLWQERVVIDVGSFEKRSGTL
jgi:hypothetical protein